MDPIHNQEIIKVIRLFKRITFFYAVFILFTSSVKGQTYYFDYYSVKEGLAQSKVYSVIQENQGYLWIGTESGVSKFDGVTFINYTTEDGLAEGGVKTLFKDSNGSIWMGHKSGGISVFINGEISIHPISSIIKGDITSFIEDNEKQLWVTTYGDGLIRIDNPYELDASKLTYEQYKGKRLSDRVVTSTKAFGDTLFFVTDLGIKKFNKSENSFSNYLPKGLTSYFPTTMMHQDRKGDIWFGTFHGGLYRYILKENKFVIYDSRDGLANNWISTIIEDSNGNIWVGTWGGGVTKFSGDSYKTYNNINGLIDPKIYCINEDVEGNILIGTNEHGLAVFKGEKFITYSTADGLADQQIWSVIEDKYKNFWFGTNKGISVYNPTAKEPSKKFTYYNQEKNSVGNQIRFLKNDRDGNLWVGTNDNGLNMYDFSTGRFIYNMVVNRYINSLIVTALDIDRQNQLWVGTIDGLVYYDINNDKSTILTQINGLSGNEISSIYVDSKDKVWVGVVNKGLNFIQDTLIKQVDIEGLLTPECMVEDKDGNIWIGTNNKGIFVYNGNQVIRTITQNDGLLSNLITQLNIDIENNIYVGTSQGLNKIDNKGNIHTYTEKSGFTGIEAKKNATYRDNDGNLWFGTVKGVVKYQPKMEIDVPKEPLTHISKLRVNLKDRIMKSDQKFNYRENSIIFDYNSICLTNPDAVKYQIMLDPADHEWRPVTDQTMVNYSSLAPDKYTFKVKAMNSSGVWNTEPVTYTFTISPPFYKSWWFISAIIILGSIGIISYIKVREKNLIKEKRILEEKVAERTAEVVQKSIEIEKKNKDITDSIKYAKRIQTAVLPPEIPFENTFVLYRPKDIVSGDFYWLETVGNKEMIAAVDCTGHGVPGAFLAILGHSMLTKIVREYGILQPAEILDRLDVEIISALHQKDVTGERIVNDGMDLAIMCYNKDTQILEYAGAYNPLFHIRNGELEEIKADRFPIGMTNILENKKFTNHEIKIEKGDAFYIFSDGYADQFGGDDGRKLRKKNMKDLIVSYQNIPMKEQSKELENYIVNWMANYEQVDDIVVIGRGF
ncbi:MAG: hypothetical protein A2041_01310 [Bacteroidetes bacterium GWA2_31_9b]|nr:MAG: hypothetical protein A2041_01310 [Bacteroidetes bacterium GWA2_31_9b]